MSIVGKSVMQIATIFPTAQFECAESESALSLWNDEESILFA